MDNSVAICALAALLAYLAGSIPFGLLIGFAKGIDVRKAGSGNIGATNVLRVVGKPWGALAFLLDFLKGVAGALLAPAAAASLLGAESGVPNLAAIIGGLGAVAGHNWPVWLRFKGGKGVATSAGMLVAIVPAETGCAFAVWLAVLLLSRYVSLASICAALALAAAVWLRRPAGTSIVLPVLVSVLAAFVILRHRANIGRLLAGNENRFEFRKKGKSASESR